MKKWRTLVCAALPLAAVLTAACGGRSAGTGTIVCTTAMLGTVARNVAGPDAAVNGIVPAGMCPGHFDVKPGDIASVARADLLLYHGWEQWLDGLLQAVDRRDLVKEKVAVEGGWMVPGVHIRGTAAVRDVLVRYRPERKDRYDAAAAAYVRTVEDAAQRIRETCGPLAGVDVVCSGMQKDLLEWAGCRVVAAYGRAEDLSPKMLENLVRTARDAGARLVVDNLQSGAKAGVRIAEASGAVHVVLTNFPTDGSYTASLEDNVRKLLKAVARP